MYCKYCGKEIESNDRFCSHCGKNVVDIQNSGLALTGLILGILSSIFYGLIIFQVLAVIFSIIALIKIKNKKASGKVMAIIGLILGIVYILQFGIKVFKNTEYYETLYKQAFMEQEIDLLSENEKNNLEGIVLNGTWSNTIHAGEIITTKTLELYDNSFVVRNEIISTENGKIEGFMELYGTAQITGNIVTLHIVEASKTSTMPTNILIGTTDILTLKNNKLVYENGIELTKIK